MDMKLIFCVGIWPLPILAVLACSSLALHCLAFRCIICINIKGQKWLTSWGYTTKPAVDHDKLIDLGMRATKAIEAVHGRTYQVESAGALYPAGIAA